MNHETSHGTSLLPEDDTTPGGLNSGKMVHPWYPQTKQADPPLSSGTLITLEDETFLAGSNLLPPLRRPWYSFPHTPGSHPILTPMSLRQRYEYIPNLYAPNPSPHVPLSLRP